MEAYEGLVWAFVLPAVAECTASVWLPAEMESAGGLELKVLFLNLSGGLIEGFFTAWEEKRATPNGALTGAMGSLAGNVRASFLSAYTSWAGMVCYSAVLAHQRSSLRIGALYLITSVSLGILAHQIGSRLAVALSAGLGKGSPPSTSSVRSVRYAVLAGCLANIGAAYTLLKLDLETFDSESGVDSELHSLIAFLDDESSRLLVAIACSIAGAAAGNALDAAVAGGSLVPRGTLTCNLLFPACALLLPAASLRKTNWTRSVLLQSFTGSFCGAASAFAGHCSDCCALWRSGGVRRALANVTANLSCALLVLFLGYELERLLAVRNRLDANGNGVIELTELALHYNLTRSAPPVAVARRKMFGLF